MNSKEIILSKIIEYLQLKIPNFKIEKRGKKPIFTCPICKSSIVSCNIIPNTYIIYCFRCVFKGNLIDIVRYVEGWIRDDINKTTEKSEYDVLKYLKELLKIDVILEEDKNSILEFYEKLGFDMVPIAKNQKIPIEKDWTNKEHKDIKEWKRWIEDGLNIGVKTGKRSNITVIDVDTSEIPKEFEIDLDKIMYQKTNKGWHLFFQFEEDLPKTRIVDMKVDIETTGGQVVVFPSTIDGIERKLHKLSPVKMPDKLKKFIKSKITITGLKTFSEKLKEDIKTEKFDLKVINEGNRTNFLMHFGGVLRKELNLSQTDYTLNIVNRHFCTPQLPQREVDNIVKSLEKYITFDEQELSVKILQYMKIVEDANSKDIREAIGEYGAEGKQRVEKAIKFLVKEGFLYKKRRNFYLIKRAEWRDEFIEDGRKLDYKIPYFDDYAIFRNGDMIVVGAKQGVGKSHISINMIKRLVNQGQKPYYVSLESGNRFVSIAMALGLKEGDFNWCVHFSPQDIELEKNAITIIDWLCPDNYAETDKLYKHFAEQLVKNNGILIIFAQLRNDGEFMAKDMIKMFPAVVSKYLYEDEEDGTNGYFLLTKIREPKFNKKTAKIPCRYNWGSKELRIIGE